MNQTELANRELITQVLQEILAEKPLPAACQCHWIDPHKFRMLLWKDLKDNQETYILKIAEQKFVGESRLDKRGVVYWRFRSLYEDREAQSTEDLATEKNEKAKPTEPQINFNKPLGEQTAEDRKKWAEFAAQQPEAKSMTATEYLAKLREEKSPESGLIQEVAN